MARIVKILIRLGAVVFLAFAHYWALRVAPPDRMMGDVYRILFVHVPAAWGAMLFFTVSFFSSLVYLVRRKRTADLWAESGAEVGVVLTGLALALGSLWGRPVWGVWWTWDPRLTTTALLFLMYLGYLILRRQIPDPEKRGAIAAVVGVLIFLNVPIVYLSVKWWRSLHQVQSSPETMEPSMIFSLRLCAAALLSVSLLLFWERLRLARARRELEERGEGG